MTKNSRNLIPTFLENSDTYFVAIINLDGKYVYCNDNYARTFNIDDEGIWLDSQDLFITQAISCKKGLINDLLKHPKNCHEIELKKFSKVNHDYMWTKWEVSGWQENNILSGIIFIGHDITENVKNNDYISKQDRFLEAIYNSTNEASTFLDCNFKIVFNNKKAKEITRSLFGKEAEIGDVSINYFFAEIREEFQSYYDRVILGETISVEKFDGQSWWKFTLFPVTDKFNKIVGISQNVIDISEEKIKEKIIIETKNNYKNLVENSHGVIFSITKEGLFEFVSESIKSLLGYEVKELENKLFFTFIHPDDKEISFNIIKNIYETKNKVSGIKFRALHKNGSYKWLLANGGPVFKVCGEIKVATATAIDIDHLVQRETKILQQNDALKKIAWNQSHIVRRPVANILGICQKLNIEEGKVDMSIIDYLKKSVEDLDKIIHENVDISHQFFPDKD